MSCEFIIYYHPDCLKHDPGPNHPEQAERLQEILKGIQAQPLLAKGLQQVAPATIADLEVVHDRSYLLALEEACLSGKGSFMNSECGLCCDSWPAMMASGGMALALGDHLTQGGSGFALTRPPGHHAGRNRAEGFCFLNHTGLAIARIREKLPETKFLVVDFDVHHGNGIDYLFHTDPEVYYFSIHGSPAHIYPGTGFASEVGLGEAVGRSRNITLDLGCEGQEWLTAFSSGLKACIEDFCPDILLFNAGFDAHIDDPYGLMRVDDESFFAVATQLYEVAEQYCCGTIGGFLEGGYNPEVLKRILPRFLRILSGSTL